MDEKLDILLSNTADVSLRRRAKWIINNLHPKIGERIIDLGCGDGFYIYLLSNLGLDIELYGLDNDQNSLKSALKNIKSKEVKFKKADLMKKLSFPDEYFHGIVMSEVMEHLPDDYKCMKEANRILKKNGRIVISVPNNNYPFFWDPINWILERVFKTHIKSGFWAGVWNQHIRLYSEANLKLVLEESGFKKIKISKLTHYCLPFNHHIINLGARILANKITPSFLKQRASKFNSIVKNKRAGFNFFSILFKFDKLNNNWNGQGATVSLLASATK